MAGVVSLLPPSTTMISLTLDCRACWSFAARTVSSLSVGTTTEIVTGVQGGDSSPPLYLQEDVSARFARQLADGSDLVAEVLQCPQRARADVDQHRKQGK